MNRILIVTVLALLLLVAPAALAKSTVTVDALGLFFGTLSVEFETTLDALGDRMTLVVPGSLRGGALELGAGVRYYVDGVRHDGLYVGGHAGLLGLHGGSGGTTVTGSTFGVTGVAGYKWHLNNGFTMDAGATVRLINPVRSYLRLGVGLVF